MPLVKQRGLKGLNFSILCDVFLLISLVHILETNGQTIEIVSDAFSEDDLTLKPISGLPERSDQDYLEITKHFDAYSDFSKTPHDTIHRILRDEDSRLRSDEGKALRWEKSEKSPVHRKVSKREIETHLPIRNSSNTRSENSTKSLDLVNSNLTKFVIDSDLELQIKQLDDRRLITRLNLTNNLISEFSTKSLSPWLTGITNLDLSYNRLRKFVLSSTSQLINVNLSANNISSFLIETNDTILRTLSIQTNNLTNQVVDTNLFDFSSADQLETLDLSCNEISKISRKLIGRGRSLRRLNLSHNRLQRIEKDIFYNSINIETLVLSYNQIVNIATETFLVLPNLQFLDLSYNKLGAESIRALQGIPDLVGLSIAYNPGLGDALQEFVASWSLKELDASGTGLCQIPSALAQSVRTLVLVDNWFEVIRCGDLDSYPLLQYLDLSHSHITDVEDDALGRLEILQTLFLDHNKLKRIPSSLPTNLENLFLQNNEINDIQPQSLQQLINLRTLDLSHNKLTYIPGLPLPKLLVFNLQSSGVRGLSQSVVKTSPKLRDLLLDDNPIKCTELMAIAEWASPCQNRDTTNAHTIPFSTDKENRQSIKEAFVQTHNYLAGFPAAYQQCTGEYKKREDYKIRPLCATIADDLPLQLNKLEMQFNETVEEITLKKAKVFNNSDILNKPLQDVENSVPAKPPSVQISTVGNSRKRHESDMDWNSTNYLASHSSSQSSILPNEIIPRNDDKIKKHIQDNGQGENRGNDETQSQDNFFSLLLAQSSTTMPSTFSSISLFSQYQLQQNLSGNHIIMAKIAKKNIRQKQQQTSSKYYSDDASPMKIISAQGKASSSTTFETSTVSTEFSARTKNNSLLNTNAPENHQISTNSYHDKLDQTLTSTSPIQAAIHPELHKQLLSTMATTIPINDSISDERKTSGQGKLMLSASQAIDEDDVVRNSTKKVFPTTATTAEKSTNDDRVIYDILASPASMVTSFDNTSSSRTVATTTVSTKTRIISKMLSSKVNKADKVVNHHQLSPSAINENSIFKRNQGNGSYQGPSRMLAKVERVEILTAQPSYSEKLRSSPAYTSWVDNMNNKNEQERYQDISQQNQRTTAANPASYTWASLIALSADSLKKKTLHLSNKVKDDKHLRFIGAKNLNVTVLTYNKMHKTINKDIGSHFRNFSTTQSSDQLLLEVGTMSDRIQSIDFQSTSAQPPAINAFGDGIFHVKVNEKRIRSESSNHPNNQHQKRQNEADLHPQLNALHTLLSAHLNSSAYNATGNTGLTPQQWLDIRNVSGHPGLFIVIALTIGVIFILGLIHIYRCRRPAPWRRASHLNHLNNSLHSSHHCCKTNGIETGNSGTRHEYSPGHFCSYSYNGTEDDAGYYIEPDQNRTRTSSRRDFLPMELLSANYNNSNCRENRTTTSGRHYPEGQIHSIW